MFGTLICRVPGSVGNFCFETTLQKYNARCAFFSASLFKHVLGLRTEEEAALFVCNCARLITASKNPGGEKKKRAFRERCGHAEHCVWEHYPEQQDMTSYSTCM